MTQKWPDVLWLVRHGESAGNVASAAAEASGAHAVNIPHRDCDVPLSPLGERQAAALGRWLGSLAPGARPTVLLTSPYVRARRTADLALAAAGLDRGGLVLLADERLREREFGIFDRLTKAGAREKYPEQAEALTALGKFYHRPPGGESWCDVILRLRNVVDTVTREYRRERVLVVAHSAVIFCFRYLLENMTEEEVLRADRDYDVANCGVTTYEYDPGIGKIGGPALRSFNFVAPLEEAGETITAAPDVPVAPK
ncbi:MAG TPA: histidine phosphatase family protein [Pyrinomonadaceae bacterium]|nr:histidine phosphatase family protein [Pyrinomonadaceae bacterium]